MKKSQPSRPSMPYERLSASGRSNRGGQKKKARAPFGKAVFITLIICSVLLVAGLIGAASINRLLNLVDRTPVTGDPDLHETDLIDPGETVDEPDSSEGVSQAEKEYQTIGSIKIPADPKVRNILLIGSDMRPGETRGRSDAMIILSINERTQTIHLTSLMRAMYVNIPGKGWSLLNHAFSWGGPDMLLQTIENNLRVRIDDYMVINFAGFTEAIDLVGGVEITLTEKEAAYLNADLKVSSMKTGVNHLDGAAALAYARIRKIDSDFQRTGRQRTVMESLLKKSRSLNPVQLTNLASSLLPLVTTNMSQTELLGMIVDSMQARNYPVEQLMLPLKEHREMIYVRKMETYRFDFQKTVQTLHDFIYGS